LLDFLQGVDASKGRLRPNPPPEMIREKARRGGRSANLHNSGTGAQSQQGWWRKRKKGSSGMFNLKFPRIKGKNKLDRFAN